MDRLVTVFGGGGFLGRYVVQELMAAGARVRVAQRDPRQAFRVRPLGGLGQSQFVAASLTKPDSVRRAVEGADSVVNLVGVLAGDFQGLHVDGARNVAEAAREAGAQALVHVSAIGADPDAASAYGRSKGLGEVAVRAAFPDATIVRPSILFGTEDNFINRFAELARLLPVLPVIAGNARFQPAWVGDAGRAVALAAIDPGAHAGRTYALGGPQEMTMAQLNGWIAEAIGRRPRLALIPDRIAAVIAKVGGRLPGAPITWDQWLMLQQPNVVGDLPGFAAFDIEPKPLAAVAPRYLVRYRRQGRFSLNAA